MILDLHCERIWWTRCLEMPISRPILFESHSIGPQLNGAGCSLAKRCRVSSRFPAAEAARVRNLSTGELCHTKPLCDTRESQQRELRAIFSRRLDRKSTRLNSSHL